MDRQQEFEELVAAGLQRFRERAVARLRDILGREFPPDLRVLWFEIQSDTDGLPVRVHGLDEAATDSVSVQDPVRGGWWSVLSEPLVPDDSSEYIPFETIEDYEFDVPVGTYEHAATLIAGFVRDCYLEAGGAAHPLRAFANHHDRGRALDLKTGSWVKVDDIQHGRA
jgi:hypothetical protein